MLCGRCGCKGKKGKGKGKGRERKGKEGKGKERLETDGEKKPLGMSELGCADGCGRQTGGGNCADGCGGRGCKGVAGNGWGEEAAGDERAWLRGRLIGWGELRGRLRTAWVQKWLEMGGEKKPRELGCSDGCGRRGCKGVGGNGRGEDAGDERAWLCGRLRTAWVQEMGGEKKPLGMSELGCADGCGRRGCKGVAGNGLGEQVWKMVACWLAMCAYRLTDNIDARGWGQGMGGDMG